MTGYSFDNTLAELLKNEQTRKILFTAIPQLADNSMLAQAQEMSFRTIIGFMGGAVPAEFLEKIELQLKSIPFETGGHPLPEVEDPNAMYFDPALPVDQRVEDLLSRMTLDEKLAQMCSDMATALAGMPAEKLVARLHGQHPNGLGRYTQYSVVGIAGARQIAEMSNTLQNFYCKHTRLGIPVMLQTENLSGYPGFGGTIFPAMLGAAATFDESLVEQMGGVIGRETRAVGAAQGLSPVLDLARDPRWGRTYETFGEDPYLVSQMGKAYIRGMQGDKKSGTLATGKHFLGYSETQAGLNTAATRLGDRELYDCFATPFEAAIKDAGLSVIMTSYSEIDGIPCGANKRIVRKLLRERLGFDGLVVSDGAAVWKLFDTYHVAKTYEEAGLLGIKGGMETEMPVGDSYKKLGAYVESGELDVALIDDAVRHVLRTKFEAGLFENPYVDVESVEEKMQTQETRRLSRSVAEKSVTLLENKESVLPLKAGRTLAVIGPHGNLVRPGVTGYTLPAYCEMLRGMMGGSSKEVTFHGMMDERKKARDGYTKEPDMGAVMDADFSVEGLLRIKCGGTTLAEELEKEFQVRTALGCDIMGADTAGFGEAVAAARQSDTVILTLGGNCGWVGTTGGEGKDRMSLALPGVQQQLLDAVAAVGKDIILVLYGPGGYAPHLAPNVKAVLYAWLPGPYGGRALADVLSGKAGPEGRLPVTLPRNAGQIPIYYYHKPASGYIKSAEPDASVSDTELKGEKKESVDVFAGGYTDGPSTPLYPFGYGLSYTTFAITKLQAREASVPTDGTIRLTCTVENTGGRAGSEVVQLYVRDMEAHVTRPMRQLCAYARVRLEPGQKAAVSFRIKTAQLGFTDEEDNFVVEPGTIRFMIGRDSLHITDTTDVVLTGPVQNLADKRSYTAAADITVGE